MQRSTRPTLLSISLLAFSLVAVSTRVGAQGRNIPALAPKPAQLTPYTAPHKPHWRLSDVLALNPAKQRWSVPVVGDALLRAECSAMAPGESTPTKFYADNPAWWVVQDGQIRFTIDGQEPFVASKGFLVQVPYRIPFRMETVGDQPSLRFEVTVAGASVLYPNDGRDQPHP